MNKIDTTNKNINNGIHKELNRIQRELKAPKSQTNSFAHFNYRSAEDILEAYKKVAGGTTLVTSDEMIQLGDRYYVKATAMLSDVSDNKESISTTAYAREAENKKGSDEAQITGATSSYARKYALNALFAIDDTKDADSDSETDKRNKSDDKLSKLQEEVGKITDIKELEKFYHANEGNGSAFAKMVTKRKGEINEIA